MNGHDGWKESNPNLKYVIDFLLKENIKISSHINSTFEVKKYPTCVETRNQTEFDALFFAKHCKGQIEDTKGKDRQKKEGRIERQTDWNSRFISPLIRNSWVKVFEQRSVLRKKFFCVGPKYILSKVFSVSSHNKNTSRNKLLSWLDIKCIVSSTQELVWIYNMLFTNSFICSNTFTKPCSPLLFAVSKIDTFHTVNSPPQINATFILHWNLCD